jgi:hypothetical protein
MSNSGGSEMEVKFVQRKMSRCCLWLSQFAGGRAGDEVRVGGARVSRSDDGSSGKLLPSLRAPAADPAALWSHY